MNERKMIKRKQTLTACTVQQNGTKCMLHHANSLSTSKILQLLNNANRCTLI